MSQGQGQQNSSSGVEVAYYAGALVVSAVVIWYSLSAQLVYYTFRLSWYQGYAMLMPLDAVSTQLELYFPAFKQPALLKADDLYAVLREIGNYQSVLITKDVMVQQWLRVLGVVGKYLMIFTSPLWVSLSLFLFSHSISGRYKDKYSMERFRQLESHNWPAISTSLGKNYAKVGLDEGPFAMSIQPMPFAKKYGLLDVSTVDGKSVATVNRERAHMAFSAQMGPVWKGSLQHMPAHVLALFAIFASKAEHDVKSYSRLMAQISRSSTRGSTTLDYSGVKAVLFKHIRSMKVAKAVAPHAYLYTALASLLQLAREDGVLASSEFLWLKLVDRNLWYMLNSVGRKTAFPEVSGPYAHWVVECKLRRPLRTPMVEEAINALESGVAEFIYHAEDEA